MTVPQWALLGFAVWTLLTLLLTVGIYRWSRILTGRASISEWRADEPQGSEWYRRAMRAHMNCVENLPVYGAIVLCASLAGASGRLIDMLAVGVLIARVFQTTIHLAAAPTNMAALIRFGFFFVQIIFMLWIAILTAIAAGA